MKLEKYALIAEIVGGFAIVVTLIVLIVELGGNTEEMRAATLANVAARTQALPLALATNPQFADLWARMGAGEELSPVEEAQVSGILVIALKLAEESFMAYRDGRLDEEVWQTRAALALNLLRRESSRKYWEGARTQGAYVPGFVDWLDTALVERYGL